MFHPEVEIPGIRGPIGPNLGPEAFLLVGNPVSLIDGARRGMIVGALAVGHVVQPLTRIDVARVPMNNHA